jgi:tRNA(Ile)-lysidine synthase
MKTSNTFLRLFTQFVQQRKLLTRQQTIIVGVSGGIDSVVLLDVLAELRSAWHLKLIIAHVNHGLRKKESDGDERFVKSLGEKYSIHCYSKKFNTRAEMKQAKLSIQETARNIRYSFFGNLKKSLNADLIATAHTASDNAETVLLNLFRGTGIDGLSGIPIHRNDEHIVRPLLFAQREEIAAYAKSRKLQWREDSSNKKEDYKRNFIRLQLIPILKKNVNASIIETLNHESQIFHSAADFINGAAERSIKTIIQKSERGYSLNVNTFLKKHGFLQQMLVRKVLILLHIEPSFSSIQSIVKLAKQQKGTIVQLNKSWIVEKDLTQIEFHRKAQQKPFLFSLSSEGCAKVNNFEFSIVKHALPKNKKNRDSSIEYVDAEKIQFPIIIRSWKYGDTFFPLGMPGSKKVSDFFTDAKISQKEKLTIPIIESDGKIVWVGGYRLDDRCKITKQTTKVYQLTLTKSHGS